MANSSHSESNSRVGCVWLQWAGRRRGWLLGVLACSVLLLGATRHHSSAFLCPRFVHHILWLLCLQMAGRTFWCAEVDQRLDAGPLCDKGDGKRTSLHRKIIAPQP